MSAAVAFHAAIFGIDGKLAGSGEWSLSQLSLRWLNFACAFLDRNGKVFRKPIDDSRLDHIEFELTSDQGYGLGSFYCRGELVTSTAYFTGANRAGEAALQQMFIQSLRRIELVRQTASSEAFAEIKRIDVRPLHIVVPWGLLSVPADDHRVVSELSNHLAGAFFSANGRDAV